MFAWRSGLAFSLVLAIVWYCWQADEQRVIDSPAMLDDRYTADYPLSENSTDNSSKYHVTSIQTLEGKDKTIGHDEAGVSLSQLQLWVYHGDESDKWRALSYMREFGRDSVPLLLNIVHGKNQLALKEQAIAVLATVDPTLLSSIVTHLSKEKQILPIIQALGVSQSAPAITDYALGLRGFKNNQNVLLIDDLMTGSESQKVMAIESISWAENQDIRQLLTWVATQERASAVRYAAIEAGLTYDSEHQQQWLQMGLHDPDPDIQTFALTHIESSGTDTKTFIADFVAILHSNSESKVIHRVIDLLSEDSSELAQNIIQQVQADQAR